MLPRLSLATAPGLSQGELVLSPRRGRGHRFVVLGLLAGAVVAGVGAGYVAGWTASHEALASAGLVPDKAAIDDELGKAQLALRLVQARGQELERQVDGVNRQLYECQEELTFFRKSRNDKR